LCSITVINMRGVLGIFFPLKGVPGTKMFENPCSKVCLYFKYTVWYVKKKHFLNHETSGVCVIYTSNYTTFLYSK